MFLISIEKKYSILCLKDTHFVKENEPIVITQWGFTFIFNPYWVRSHARWVGQGEKRSK